MPLNGVYTERRVRLQEVEPGRRYRFIFRRPVRGRSRTLVAEVGASFWGEVPFIHEAGVLRAERADVVSATLLL